MPYFRTTHRHYSQVRIVSNHLPILYSSSTRLILYSKSKIPTTINYIIESYGPFQSSFYTHLFTPFAQLSHVIYHILPHYLLPALHAHDFNSFLSFFGLSPKLQTKKRLSLLVLNSINFPFSPPPHSRPSCPLFLVNELHQQSIIVS